jgi:ribosomal protein S27AE
MCLSRLQGGIPESYKQFNRLITLKLKNNQLSGLIPDIWDEMPPGFSLDIQENAHLKPPLPPSLIRRIMFRPEHIFLDSFLYECPSGFVAPTVNSHTNFSFEKKKNITKLPITSLSEFCIPCAKGMPTVFFFNCDKRLHALLLGTRVNENGRECTRCSPGTIAPTEASSHCIKCGPGTYSKEGNDHCLLCHPGEYSYLETSAMCHPCPANHYMEYYGASYCLAVRKLFSNTYDIHFRYTI